jgi:AcrR family transcriptional regulator
MPTSGERHDRERPSARGGSPARDRELRAQGRKTMRKLLDAGITVFERRGYHAARVDDIVKVARTSHGTFYLYFSNKEDLFRALVADVAEELDALSNELGPVGADDDGYRELHDWLERFVMLYERYGAVIRAWTEAEVSESEVGRMGADVLTGVTEALVTRLRQSDTSPGIDPQVAALAAVAMVERLNYYVVSRRVRLDRAAMVDTLTALLHSGLFGATRPAGRLRLTRRS